MKYFAVILFLLFFSQESTAQIRLNDLQFVSEFKIVHDDSVSRKIFIDDNSNTYWIDSIYHTSILDFHEYHKKGLITQRSFLVSGSNKYMLDSLIIKNYNNYCLILDIARVYISTRENREYLIIECYDTFQYGSDAQPIFLVLSNEGNNYTPQSVYVMDNYSEDAYHNIYIVFDNDKVVLKGAGVSLISF